MNVKQLLTALALLFITSTAAFAANNSSADDTLKYDDLSKSVNLKYDPHIQWLDSMNAELWHREKFYATDEDLYYYTSLSGDDLPQYSDSVYNARMELIPSPIEFGYNDDVRKFIDYYVVKNRTYATKLLALSQIYFPLYEEVLDRKGLPLELKYLPIIESAFDCKATSWVGATGQWQFMYATAKNFGLNINSYVDERCDPKLSTEAATDFLAYLYNMYDDWLMAIAAYNCGPGNMNKAIKKSGGKTNYWEVRPYLPKETQSYIPIYMGATYLMEYYDEHMLMPAEPKIDLYAMDTIMIYEQVTLDHIAGVLDMDVEELKFLNPMLKLDAIPKMEEGYALNVPLDYLGLAQYHYDILVNDTTLQKKDATIVALPNQQYYTVKSGDNLGYIAQKFGVSSQNIRDWNGIKGSLIHPGQKLVVYSSNTPVAKSSISSSSSSKNVGVKPEDINEDCNCVYHTIVAGDTLWDLSNKYNATIETIKSSNNINNNTILKPGMVLKIDI